ncbi:hypothetical protein [Streptomyces sp. NPDC005262]|uniref:hypothetical protein n=1 Tax=Streptomyces sp. NPDC005262 TaxID=3364710 RepID=UPI00367B5A9A
MLATAFAAAALLLAANMSTADVGWDSVQSGSAIGVQGSDVGWDSIPADLAGA